MCSRNSYTLSVVIQCGCSVCCQGVVVVVKNLCVLS
jgi:hypothetical protein